MIHDIDLILFFVNSEIKKVEASGVSVLSDSFDLVNARLSFQNGCIANLTASRISDKPLRKLRLFEKNQYVSMDLQTNTGSIYNVLNSQKASPKGSILKLKNKHILLKKLVAKPSNALFEELVSFINSIQNAKTPTVSAVDGKKAIELAILIKDKINEQKNNYKIFIIAGEASGDLHGSGLMRSIKACNPNVSFSGLGGKKNGTTRA